MKARLLTLIQAIAALTLAGQLCSCIHLQPADREFHTVAEFAYNDRFNEAAGEISAEEALKRLPGDPNFKTLKLDRKLDSSLLQAPTGPYRVGPGDELDIEVAELKDTRARSKVMPDGMLYYDVAKGIDVKGKTIGEISTLLSKALENDYVKPVVTVNVAKADSQRFWMLGQVQKPGAYPITKPTNLISALSLGGGLLTTTDSNEVSNPEAADLERAILIRNGDLVPVDFERLVREGDMSQNVYVRGGDYIFVPSLTPRSFYVLGSVVRPGPVFFEKGATLVSAVAAAGGPQADAIATKALILRGGTLQPQVAVVNLRAIMKGQEPDLRLEGGDIVWVPRSPWSKLEDYVEAVLITAAQAVAVQEGLGVLGTTGNAGVTITAGGR
ncbi:MAG TPA: polysaccharide biosynthesis/export family protein [Bacteroidia bacterium]|nr:polysaccharide biosynthesis/export family protein [Bacteroidia bacterium]